MSVESLSLGQRSAGPAWWTRLGQPLVQRRALWPAAAIVVATAIGYHFTLDRLLDYLRLDTPLAYLPLLPGFSMWLAASAARRHRGRPVARELGMDLLLGLPMLIVAVLMITALPVVWSTFYWTDRPDVLSLALFVTGAFVLAYGVTWVWRTRAAFVFLFLMWPALYLHLMSGVLQRFTEGTNGVLGAIVEHLPLGVTAGGATGLLVVHAAQGPLQVSISTACSGANSVLGFALIGSALMLTTEGRRPLRLLWLLTGLVLTFALNVVRILSILLIAAHGNSTLALGAYHAVIGLILFAVAVTVMLTAMPLFRIRFRQAPAGTGGEPTPPSARATRRPLRPLAGGVALLGATALAAIADQGLLPYAAFADGTGAPTVSAFSASSPLPARWQVTHQETYRWAEQYFGNGSSFDRYSLASTGQFGVVWVDVVRTPDQSTLDAYNLQSCFLFHNYSIDTARRLDLRNGVTGLLLNYRDPESHAQWATVSWAWPVNVSGETQYERVTLTSDLHPGGSAAPDVSPGDGLRSVAIDVLNGLGGQQAAPASETTYGAADRSLQSIASSLVATTVQRAEH